METRANHLLIGSFVLIMVAGLFGFVIWLAKVEVDQEFAYYHIFFEGSVTGLSTAGEVRYNGIPVGSVNELVIDPTDPRRVRVMVELDTTTPVREDTVASLEPRGITGVSYVNLKSEDPESPPLAIKKGQILPVIASRPSAFEELFLGAPEAIDRFIIVATQAAKFLDEDNRQAVAGILADAKVFTGELAARSDAIGETLDNVAETSRELREAASSVRLVTGDVEGLIASAEETMAVMRGTLAGADELMTGDIRNLIDSSQGLVTDTQETMRSFTRTSDELQGVVAENRESVREFAAEARFLVSSLSRLAERLETDPAQFLFGDAEQGFEVEE
jgi:phospholipid/cholesterol/gamma-HCH transport system substrate-binding protein